MDPILCTHCNQLTSAPAKFCMHCGEPFADAPQPPIDLITPPIEPEPVKIEAEIADIPVPSTPLPVEPPIVEPAPIPEPPAVETPAIAMPPTPPPEQPDKEDKPDWLSQLYTEVEAHKDIKEESLLTPEEGSPPEPVEVKPVSTEAEPQPVSEPPQQVVYTTPPVSTSPQMAPPAQVPPLPAAQPPRLAPLETPLKFQMQAPPKRPPAKPGIPRPLRTGCIILAILFCLLGTAAAVAGVVYREEIMEWLGLTRATSVAQVKPDHATSTRKPTSTPSLTPTATPTPTLTPTRTPTATPTPSPRTLNICLANEPDNFYLYGDYSLAKLHVLQAVYDGPIDGYSFSYHPTILQKLPSLADGDALILTTNVYEGDRVLDNYGNVVDLSDGDVVRPAGCRSTDCAITYQGGSLEMDFMHVEFILVPGVTWSDGYPLTAYDSEYSFQVDADPDTGTSKYMSDRTQYYYAIDELTTIWEGLPGYLDVTYYKNFWSPLPAHIMGQYSAADLYYLREDELLLGWGPYIFESFDPGYQITFARNPSYYRSVEGLPHFDHLIYRFIGNDSDNAIASLLSGECDLLTSDINLTEQGPYLADLQSAGSLVAYPWRNSLFEHLDFNIQPNPEIINSGAFAGWDLDRDGFGPFGDVRLRQAVAYCLDRQAVIDSMFPGADLNLDGILSYEHPLMSPYVPGIWYDPQAGMALLDEIGWIDDDRNPNTPRVALGVTGVPDGTSLTFSYESTTATHRVQALQILSESLIQCGFGVNVSNISASELFRFSSDGRLFGRLFDLGQFAWVIYEDDSCDLYTSDNIPGDPGAVNPDGSPRYPEGWNGVNDTGYSNPDYDFLCDFSKQLLLGEQGYEEYSWEVQAILAYELPAIPLYSRMSMTAARNDFCAFYSNSVWESELWNLEEFDYGENCGY